MRSHFNLRALQETQAKGSVFAESVGPDGADSVVSGGMLISENSHPIYDTINSVLSSSSSFFPQKGINSRACCEVQRVVDSGPCQAAVERCSDNS